MLQAVQFQPSGGPRRVVVQDDETAFGQPVQRIRRLCHRTVTQCEAHAPQGFHWHGELRAGGIIGVQHRANRE